MAKQVCNGAMLKCAMGAAPGAMIVLPTNKTMGCSQPAANIMDNKPFANIPTFGMCKAPTNPAVIAIIASSLGAVTQAPCIPATVAPWIPGGAPTVLIGNMPALNDGSKLLCTWLGMIEVTSPGQATVDIP